MTNPTPHGQVPEALRLAHIFDNPLPPEWPDMVAAAAELRRQHTRIAELESELEAIGAGGVQALSAAPEAAPRIFLVTEHYSKDGRLKPVYGSSLRKILSGHSTLNSAECARAEAEDAYNVLYPGYRQYGNQLPYAWVVQEFEVMPNTASPTPPAEQPIGELVVTKTRDGQIVSVTRQDDEGRVKLLAECRDAFPIPEPGGPLEVHWAAAMADPDEVPEYVRLCVAAMQTAPKAAPAVPDPADIIAGALQISRGHAIEMMREALEAVPQQEAQEPDHATFALWYADHIGDDNKPVRDAAWETYQAFAGRTAPQPAPDCHHRPPCDECAALAVQRRNK